MGNGVLFVWWFELVFVGHVEALAASGEGKHIMFGMFAGLCMVLVGILFSFLYLEDIQYSLSKIGLYTILNLVVLVFKFCEEYRNHPTVNRLQRLYPTLQKWVTTSNQVFRGIKQIMYIALFLNG